MSVLMKEHGITKTSQPKIALAGKKPPGILPREVRVAIESMKRGAAPGPDNINAGFLRLEATVYMYFS
ncbi:unnamed protein product [Angiostrongylus costaricensis]|uniref:Nitroreductase domain-containing protein n=1 Tax=Angiostrongylus costaricensis TaxID=334426 RepID=A0A0R3Q107_ANGCS|nr:unnamed protein product [Angiostrongylus costaricensis]